MESSSTDTCHCLYPWRSRFSLASQCLTTFQVWWSCFPTLDGDISQWHTWGPISILESAQILWSHVAYQQYHGERCTSTLTMSKKTTCSCHRWSAGWMSKTAYKRRHAESSSIATRLYVNKTGITQCPHCQSSFCPPLNISFQFRFSMFDNISHVMIWISTTAWQHFMRTYIIISGVRPNLFDLMLHTSNTTVHLTQWCQGHLDGGETGQQGNLDFRL